MSEIQGTNGDDILRGGPGDDLIIGGVGRDELFGGRGEDYLIGGLGDDILDGGLGDDLLKGGPGSDTFVFKQNSIEAGDRDTIIDFETNDFLSIAGFTFGSSTINQFGQDVIFGTSFGDLTVTFANGFDANTLSGANFV